MTEKQKEELFSNYEEFKKIYGYIHIEKYGQQYTVNDYYGHKIVAGGKDFINGWLDGTITRNYGPIQTGKILSVEKVSGLICGQKT